MPVDQIAALFVIGTALGGIVIWGIRLEGRVTNLHTLREGDLNLSREQRKSDQAIQTERMERIDESLEEIKAGLKEVTTLSRKVDKLSSFIGVGTFNQHGPHHQP